MTTTPEKQPKPAKKSSLTQFAVKKEAPAAEVTKLPKAPKKMKAPAATEPADEEIIQTSFRLKRSKWAKLQELSIHERMTVQMILVTALEREFAARGLAF